MLHLRIRVWALGCLACVIPATGFAKPRKWTSANGAYHLTADAIAFNDDTVVLKREDGTLVAVEIKALSEADREFVASKEAQDAAKKSAEEMQTWTSADGLKVRGQILKYGRKSIKVVRQRGKVTIDGKRFGDMTPLHQKVVLRVISKLEEKQFLDEKQLTEWSKSLGGQGKTYELEGVLMRLESGDEIPVPFFMFAKDDLAVLEPGWKVWLEGQESEEERERESFLMRTQAMAYQRDRAAQQQIEVMKLELLGAATGVTNIWQVGLVPAQGRYGRPLAVMVSAPNSALATRQALSRYPGYVVAGVRKASY